MQDLFNDLIRRFVGMVVGAALSALQPLIAELEILVSPFIERRS
jgi:hypothetical protein